VVSKRAAQNLEPEGITNPVSGKTGKTESGRLPHSGTGIPNH